MHLEQHNRALATDFYERTMAAAYFELGITERAACELPELPRLQERARDQLRRLPARHRRLRDADPYPVQVSARLQREFESLTRQAKEGDT